MKFIAAASILPLAFACLVSSAFAQDVAEQPKASPSSDAAEFPEELKTRAPESLEEVKLLETRVQELVEKIRPATISIYGGTGVVVSEDGYILTAGHVTSRPGRRVRIRFPDGRRAMAVTLGVNERYDSGMAKIVSEGDFPFLEMGKSSEIEQGEWCLAVGFPVSFSRSDKPPVRLGRVLSNRGRTMMSDCPIMGGDSGGPLFDLDGKVIGINSRVGGSLNQNMHIPVDVFTQAWDSLTQSEAYNQAGQLKPSPERRGYLGINKGRNATTVGQVIDGSPAARAGMKAGDLIVEVAGKKTETFADVADQLSNMTAGTKVTFKVRRDDQEIELTATLGTRN